MDFVEAEEKTCLRKGETMCLMLSKVPVLVNSDCYNKIPQTRWLKQQIYFLTVWRLNIQDQGASKVDVWRAVTKERKSVCERREGRYELSCVFL